MSSQSRKFSKAILVEVDSAESARQLVDEQIIGDPTGASEFWDKRNAWEWALDSEHEYFIEQSR